MVTTRHLLSTTAAVGLGFLALGLDADRAAAQVGTDFASCAPDLGVCDANHEDCCVRAFDPIASDKAIVIPMDRCHQVVAQGGALAPPTVAAAWCANPGPFSANDNGMYEAYGLVFRLMQNGIPVYWAINPTKEAPALTSSQNLNSQSYANKDVDMWILSAGATAPSVTTTALTTCNGACVAPVKLLNPSTLAPSTTWTYSKREFPLRGGAFIIAPEDRARFNNLYRRTGEFASFAGNANYDFSAVDLYEVANGAKFVYQDYRTASPYTLGNGGNGAPVAVRIDYAPPRLARFAPAGVSQTWLSMAKLNVPANYPACMSGAFAPADAVFCDVTKTDIGANTLVSGRFDWAWIDNWSSPANPCSDPTELAQVDRVRDFMTAVPGVRAGGHVVFMESVIDLMERCPSRQPLGTPGAVGLVAANNPPAEPLILRRPQNVFMQWGDLPTSFAQGAVTRWRYFGGGANGYAPAHLDPTNGTLVRLVSEDRSATGNALCSRHRSTPACDVFAQNANADYYDVTSYLRYNDNPANGIAFYMGGNQITNGPSHLRMVLNTLISLPLATTPQLPNSSTHEVARSAPIVGFFGGVETAFHGSFTLDDPAPVIPVYEGPSDDSTFEFPYSKGHYRATEVGSNDVIFDAADHIPAATVAGCGTWFSASCRTVFTNTTSGRNPVRTFISTSERSTLQPLLGAVGTPLNNPAADTLISRILAGHKLSSTSWVPALGGIDRSTGAVIEPSPLVPNQRPTMAYVGGLDGMLHAFCIDITGPCQAKGQELWAFVPRVLLPRLRYNDGRLDGSPKVADVFGDYNGDGRREWKTVLTFQVGSGQPGVDGFAPAVYAIDISNPATPTILWEVTPPTTRGPSELGVGLSLAMAPAQTTTGSKNFTYVVSSNGGTGNPGLHVMAIATETGAVTWTWSHTYPAARAGANPPVPASGIPGGPVVIDRNQTGSANELAVPSLYGDVWLLTADTGQSMFGASPLFRFSSDFHPVGASPTLYRDGTGLLRLVLGSGGYADPVSTSWSPDNTRQYLVSVAIDPAATPLDEGSAAPDVAFAVDLGLGERAYAQAVIAGGELYVTTDRTDVNDSGYGLENDTGTLLRIALGTGTVRDSRTIHSGAASADAAGGKAYTADDVGVGAADYSSDFDANGVGTEYSMISSTGAKLWLRIE